MKSTILPFSPLDSARGDPEPVEAPNCQIRADFLEQILIVRHQQNRPVEFLQGDVERVDRFEIEVVRRLVEDEHVRLLQHDPAEQQARGLPPDSASVGFRPRR